MPYDVRTSTLPCGARCVRVEASGVIHRADAEYLMTFIGQGGTMYGVPVLILTQKMTSLSAEARGVFGASDFGSGDAQAWSAMVVTSPLIRVISNFLSRINGYRRMKMFSTEEAGTRWLDERAREDGTKVGAKAS